MPEFVSCKHCGETGTCRNAFEGNSCARCKDYWIKEIKTFKPKDIESGLVCSVCWGKGVTEPTSSKWLNRFTPVLAGGFVLFAFALLFFFGFLNRGSVDFDKILVFASTLIGSITGYYFGGEKATSSAVSVIRKLPAKKTDVSELEPASQQQQLRAPDTPLSE
jgi:hypothetical protein